MRALIGNDKMSKPKPQNATRKNITQPPQWWRAFQSQAEADGMNLSEWLGQCAIANLPVKVQRQLIERPIWGKEKAKTTAK